MFDQYAIHTWFEGYDRSSSDKGDYIFVHFLPLANAWIWQIPITDSITSFGVVTQKKYFEKTTSAREKFFWDCMATRPEILKRLQAAKQIRPFSAEGDYSYAMKEICGDGFILIGDAARFVDPIFSSGVSVALNSARFASHDIISTLEEGGVFTRQSFKRYETLIRRGTSNWYEFISLYYRLNILFTAFINNPEYRLDILKLLQGDVYDDDASVVLKKMREVVTIVENDKTHLWHNSLGDLTANTLGAALT